MSRTIIYTKPRIVGFMICALLLASGAVVCSAQTTSGESYYPLLLPVEVTDRLQGDSLHVAERLGERDGFLTITLSEAPRISIGEILARMESGEIRFGDLELDLQDAEVQDDSLLRIPYSLATGEDVDYVRSRIEFSRSLPVRGAGMTLNFFSMQENRLALHFFEEKSAVLQEIDQTAFPNPYGRLRFFVNSDSVDVRIVRPGRPDRVLNTGRARQYSPIHLQGPVRVHFSTGGNRELVRDVWVQPGKTIELKVDTKALKPGWPGFYHRNRTWVWVGLSAAVVSGAAILLTSSSGTDATTLPPPPARPLP